MVLNYENLHVIRVLVDLKLKKLEIWMI